MFFVINSHVITFVITWLFGMVWGKDTGKRFVMKLRRVSTHSYAVTVPKELVTQFGWRERQKLEVSVSGNTPAFTVRDWKRK